MKVLQEQIIIHRTFAKGSLNEWPARACMIGYFKELKHIGLGTLHHEGQRS